jgi:flavin reductase (DIM6/NTAB) family NADH-FMN oxidoreductase RutF
MATVAHNEDRGIAGPRPAAPETFRAAMRELASGVCLITSGSGDQRRGMTATSVSSLSADPPTLLVCVNRSASIYPFLTRGQTFAVNVLAAEQSEIANHFAGRTGVNGAERFQAGQWRGRPEGPPLLRDAAAVFECEVEDLLERHTHAILIGRVVQSFSAARSAALVYWRGDYDRIGWSAEEASRAVGLTADGIGCPAR